MKKNIRVALTALLVLLSFVTLTYTGCKKDKCKKVTCTSNGVCKDGNCICPAGYGGKTCETLLREAYQKSYEGEGVDSDGDKYPGTVLKFSARGTEVTDMKLEISDANGPVNSFDVVLEATTGAYSLVPKTQTDGNYSGSGTLSDGSASLKLTRAGTRTLEVNYMNMTAR